MASRIHVPTGSVGSTETSNFNLALNTLNQADISSGTIVATLPAVDDAIGQIVRVRVTNATTAYNLQIKNFEDSGRQAYLYAPGYTSEFFSDGADWYWLRKGQAYIDRGDPSSSDFSISGATLTANTSYNVVSLSSIVPITVTQNDTEAGRVCVMGDIRESSAGAVRAFRLRKNGYANAFNSVTQNVVGDNQVNFHAFVDCDSSRQVECFISSGADDAYFSVVGWYVSY